MDNRLRILCLHGWRTSAQFMKYQLVQSGFCKEFEDLAEFVCINGTHETMSPTEANVAKIVGNGPYYQWWRFNEKQTPIVYEGLNESLDYISNMLSQDDNGGFDGLLGFSQGGAMASYIGCKLQNEDTSFKGKTRFIMCIGAFVPRDQDMRCHMENSAPITIPSLHVYGTNDFVYKSGVELATKMYLNAEIIEHDKGHLVPSVKDPTVANSVRKFLLSQKCKESKL